MSFWDVVKGIFEVIGVLFTIGVIFSVCLGIYDDVQLARLSKRTLEVNEHNPLYNYYRITDAPSSLGNGAFAPYEALNAITPDEKLCLTNWNQRIFEDEAYNVYHSKSN